MILDTNAVSALLTGDKALGLVLAPIAKPHLPYVVLAEFLFGMRSSAQITRLQLLFRKLEAASLLLFPDRVTVELYAEIRSELKQQGTPIPEGDLWIAALARQHSLPIVSRDTHFDVVSSVSRLSW